MKVYLKMPLKSRKRGENDSFVKKSGMAVRPEWNDPKVV
jgi:hypothetical protein